MRNRLNIRAAAYLSLAFTAWTAARGEAATSRGRLDRWVADLDQVRTEIALLEQELRIKAAGSRRIPPRRRPYFRPVQRMRILRLKAARGWSASQTAKAFLVTEATIASWWARVDEEGERAFVQLAEPVNRFPDCGIGLAVGTTPLSTARKKDPDRNLPELPFFG